MILRAGVATFCLGALLASGARAQSGGIYALSRSEVGSGQTFASGGVYQLGSTVGQPDANSLCGGAYVVNGGFWGAASSGTVDVPDLEPTPKVFAFRLPEPNPFHGSTTIAFELPSARS